MRPNPSISIVVPTFNRVNTLMEVLRAIQRQSLKDFEVIIVDNGPSHDDTSEQVRNLSQVDERFIYVSSMGRGDFIARNNGCQRAQADLILTTDDDWIMSDPNTLTYIVRCFDEDEKLGVLGISECYPNDKAKGKFLSITINRNWKRMLKETTLYYSGKINRWGMIGTKFHYLPMGKKLEVDHVRSSCMAFRRKVAQGFAYFPTFYVINRDNMKFLIGYRSETEFCRCFAKAGYKILFSSEIQGLHKVKARPSGVPLRSQTPAFLFATGRNNMLFFLRNYWSRLSSTAFIIWDILVGNSTQPGLFRFLIFSHLKSKRHLLASLLGKLCGVIDYHTKYYNLRQTT